jgi:hypothetical protein
MMAEQAGQGQQAGRLARPDDHPAAHVGIGTQAWNQAAWASRLGKGRVGHPAVDFRLAPPLEQDRLVAVRQIAKLDHTGSIPPNLVAESLTRQSPQA